MFTGIIAAIGSVVDLEPRDGDVRLTINGGNLGLSDVNLGDSIACNGACLTAVELTQNGFIADVSVETLNLTTINHWEVGSPINLEKAMQATDRFGGHIVSGHVDGVGEVLSLEGDARSWRWSCTVRTSREGIAASHDAPPSSTFAGASRSPDGLCFAPVPCVAAYQSSLPERASGEGRMSLCDGCDTPAAFPQ